MGTLAATRNGTRRIALAGLVILCAILALFPQQYRSAVTLAPSDPAALGLSGTLSQLGAASSVFGNQASVEITVRVAESVFVRNQVIDTLKLVQNHRFANRLEASRFLHHAIDVRSLRGGMVQIETKQRDPKFAADLIRAVADATRQRLAVINRQQTSYKRHVLEQLVTDAGDRLDKAQSAYDNFRLRTRYSDPRAAINAIGDRIPALQAAIKAKEVQLHAARQFATEDNMSVQQIEAELEALNNQLKQQRALNPNEENSVGRVVEQSTISKKMERELMISQALYESYTRYLQGTAVEDLTSNANIRLIEPPFIDTSRQVNLPFLVLGILIFLVGAGAEFYLLRPPLEPRVP